jgi:hypothetical protein
MCRHYEPEKRPYCDHERAEPPVEKESANFCDYFKPANRFESASAHGADRAKNNLAALFGESSSDGEGSLSQPDDTGDSDDPRSKLNDLFDD